MAKRFRYANDRPEDFFVETALGHMPGYVSVQKFGRNTDVDTASVEDVWDGGGTHVAPTEARVHNIASTDANDTSAGTGARTIQVYGLTDWDTAETSEAITLDGVSDVATTNSYVIIHRMKVLTKGATDVNVGTITATAVTDATVTAQINPSQGQTQMAVYGVPSVQVAIVSQIYSNVLKLSGTVSVDNKLLVNPEPDVELTNFITKHTFTSTNSIGNVQVNFNSPKVFSGPCIIKMQADVSANNTDIGAGFDAILYTV